MSCLLLHAIWVMQHESEHIMPGRERQPYTTHQHYRKGRKVSLKNANSDTDS